jgi:predicted glycosyltransferase involved in capsule biosynthesis
MPNGFNLSRWLRSSIRLRGRNFEVVAQANPRVNSTAPEQADAVPLISFCSTCKNRLWQLRQTLPANLDAIRQDGHAELVLVNYNSRDGLDRWIRRFKSDMRSGVLRYVHQRTEKFFHASKAKNLAHFGARGEFVFNLDADNFIGETLPTMRELWSREPERIIHGFSGRYKDGSYGRIGMRRRTFLRLGGYDEAMLPMGHQDRDLLSRAAIAGLAIAAIPQKSCPAIRNDIKEKIRYTGMNTYREMSAANSKRLEENVSLKRTMVNVDRKPMQVRINFSIDTMI